MSLALIKFMNSLPLRNLIIMSALTFLAGYGALAAAKPAVQAPVAPGLIAEHVNSLNTLSLSFVDVSQPVYAVKLQILKEFLAHAENPKLVLLVSDDRDIKNTNGFIKNNSPKFDFKNVMYVKAESTFLSSSWSRDFNPVMLRKKDGSVSLVLFKYVNEMDYAVDQNSIAKSFNRPVVNIDLQLEGGNILSDEAGRVYVSVAVVENNLPGSTAEDQFEAKKTEIEKTLLAKLGASEVVWVPRVKREFEGTGHVDMYLRLLKDKQAVVAESSNSEINKTLNEIAAIVRAKGFKVTRIKANSKMVNRFRNQNIFPSYTNSIIVGKSIFIPQYHVPEDKIAVGIYKKLGYEVVQIDGDSIHFGGSVHCLTYLYP